MMHARHWPSRASTSRSGSSRCCAASTSTLAEHEVVCLIGASGSGKSTLLRCVNLLEPIDARAHRRPRRRRSPRAASTSTPCAAASGSSSSPSTSSRTCRVLDNITLGPRKALGCSQGRRRGACGRAARPLRPRRQARGVPGPALGRPAAACRDRARARDAAEPAAARRGDERARPGARRARCSSHPRAGRRGHDDAHRDPRDGLRARRRQSGLLPRRGRHPRGGHAASRSSARRASRARSSSCSASSTPGASRRTLRRVIEDRRSIDVSTRAARRVRRRAARLATSRRRGPG